MGHVLRCFRFVFLFSFSRFRVLLFVLSSSLLFLVFVLSCSFPVDRFLFSVFSISFSHFRFCGLFLVPGSSRFSFSHPRFRFHFIVLFVSRFRVLCFRLSLLCFVWFSLLLHPTQMDQTFFTALCILEICPPSNSRLSSYPSCLSCPSRPLVAWEQPESLKKKRLSICIHMCVLSDLETVTFEGCTFSFGLIFYSPQTPR